MKKEKVVYLEILRIIAVFLVVYNHTRGLGYGLYEALNDFSPTYFLSLALMLLCKCAVPVFFLISGGVLLSKEESVRELFRKRILHMAIIILLFVFLQYLRIVRVNGWDSFRFSTYVIYLYAGHIIEPYWFLPAYLGYLLILPFLRKIAAAMKREDYGYFFFLALLFGTGKELIYYFTGYMWNVSVVLTEQIILYPLLGHYLTNVLVIKNRKRYVLAAAGALTLSVLSGICLEMLYFSRNGSYTGTVVSIVNPFLAVSLFVLIRGLAEKADAGRPGGKIAVLLGGTTFGVYLIEYPVRNQVEPLCVYLNQWINPLASCLIFVLLSVLISMALIYAVNWGLRILRVPFRV